MNPYVHATLRYVTAWLLIIGICASHAQERETEQDAGPEVRLALVEARLADIEGDADLDDQVREQALEWYRKTRTELAALSKWRRMGPVFAETTLNAPQQLETARETLAGIEPVALPDAPGDDMPTADIQTALLQAEDDLKTAREDKAELEAEAIRRTERRAEIPERLSAIRQLVSDLETQLDTPAADEMDTTVEQAMRLYRRSRLAALREESKASQLELANYDATDELLTLQRDLATERLTGATAFAEAWRTHADRRRRKEASDAATTVRETMNELAASFPELQQEAEETAALAQERVQLSMKLSSTRADAEAMAEKLAALDAAFQSAKANLKAVGLTKFIAVRLQNQRAALPSVRAHRRSIGERQPVIEELHKKLIEYEESRDQLVREANRELDPDLDPKQAAALREQREARRTVLNGLVTDHKTCITSLETQDRLEGDLILKAEEIAAFIDQHIFWVRSSSAFGVKHVLDTGPALLWMLSPGNWFGLLETLVGGVFLDPVGVVLLLPVIGLLVYGRRRLKRRLKDLAVMTPNPLRDRFQHTANALGISLLIAARGPALLAFLAWRVEAWATASDFAKAFAAAGIPTAGVWFGLGFIRVLLRPSGIGEAHFRWDFRIMAPFRKHLAWFIWVVVPTTMVFLMLESRFDERDARESLGRIALLALLLGSGALTHVVGRPAGPAMSAYRATRPGAWSRRLATFVYAVALTMAVGLGIAVVIGYDHTARQLAWRSVITAALVLGLALLHETARRYVFVVRRRLLLLQRRGQLKTQITEGDADLQGIDESAEFRANLASFDRQTRRLLSGVATACIVVGVWLIWSDVIPALGVLDEVNLWATTVRVTETVRDADGNEVTQVVESLRQITLADLLPAAMVALVTLTAVRHIPAMLEMVVLQHLPLDFGSRYAITSLARYLTAVIGIVSTCAAMGISWTSIQWLVAAMTVGLGFGLQEIFANFISGLIILFERPVRVGDTVTVGDVTGTVTKIRIRATTICDWNRKELVVPNREFITGRLINWTLSDTTLRLVLPVGIAYGSDTAKAQRLLLQAAAENGTVLRDPGPTALFLGFGSSSLDFELRCFIPGFESYFQTIHELHMAIDAAFRENGIEIAFPQQDVHLRRIPDMPLITPPPNPGAGPAAEAAPEA